jgi:hypothetical protein
LAPETSPTPDQVVPEVVREANTTASDSAVSRGHLVRIAADDDAEDRVHPRGGPTTEHPVPPGDGAYGESPARDALSPVVSTWIEEAQGAMARALTVGSATAWRDVAQAVAVVVDVVTATRALIEATDTAERANQALIEATDTAEEATQAARAAAEIAQAATQAAEAAEQAAQAAGQTAKAKAEAVRAATKRAEEVNTALAQASDANTPEAWHEAATVAQTVVGPAEADDASVEPTEADETATSDS